MSARSRSTGADDPDTSARSLGSSAPGLGRTVGAGREAGAGDRRWRQEQIGQFLRSRRTRLSPHDVGIEVGAGRRVAGLRREEVAERAHLSVTWYMHLEQGRGVRPSAEVLGSLADALRLDHDEARYLHVLAHGPAGPGPPHGDLLRTNTDLVVALHRSLPDPVHALNHYCDVTAWNDASRDWYGDWAAMPIERRNYVDWLLFEPQARERLVEWGEEVRDIVARWRAQIASSPVDDRVRGQIARYLATSEEFARWWFEHPVLDHHERLRVLHHPHHGVRRFRAIMIGGPAVAGGVLLHFPVDPPIER